MLDIIYSLLLGVVQGLTEFLPVSSSAHLVLIPKILNLKSEILNSLTFDVILHSGTLMAVLIYFRKKIIRLLIAFFKGAFNSRERNTEDFKLSVYIIIATIPAFLAGFFFNDYAENIFRNPVLIACVLIVFAVFLFIADKNKNLSKDMNKITVKDALIIGCFQMLAIIPGVSRSGITITAALLSGMKREDSAEFSFLLSVPVIAGAFVFKTGEVLKTGMGDNSAIFFAGFFSAFVAGFLAILFLINFVKKNSFLLFVIYRILLGIIIIGLFLRI